MRGLTYAERELMLQTFDTLRHNWHGSDATLLADACAWARRLEPAFGFEHALTRDVALLSRYLIEHASDCDLADIARGGLLYIQKANQDVPPGLHDLGLLDDAFVCSYAVHEIRTRLGDSANYSLPRLSSNEQAKAEELFIDLLGNAACPDETLISESRSVCQELASLATLGVFRRFSRNVEFLITVLNDFDASSENRDFARAALGYVACTHDAIDDRLGIIGYLDDNFIVQTAVDLIDSSREPWLALLDATVAVWPFLNMLVMDDGDGGRPLSEYMIVNSALSCGELRKGTNADATVLLLPEAGPVPFLLGFVSTLGCVQDCERRGIDEHSFRAGQKVLVDCSAVAEFDGFDTIGDRRVFWLKQYRRERGQQLSTRRAWPVRELSRLVPAATGRATRGALVHDSSKSDADVPPIEYLFSASTISQFASVSKRTLVVTPVNAAHELAGYIRLVGHSLRHVVPMGRLADTGEIYPWSNRFGTQQPLLIFTSDLDLACAFAEEEYESIEQVIVNADGHISGKSASIRRMSRLVSTLVVSSERNAASLETFQDEAVPFWEWSEQDFSTLLWPVARNGNSSTGVIAGYEQRLKLHSAVTPVVDCVPMPGASDAFDAVKRLQSLAKQRDDDRLAELDEAVARAFGVMTRLFRLAAPLDDSSPVAGDISSALSQLSTTCNRSMYLTDAERETISRAELQLRTLFLTLKSKNPKVDAIRALLSRYPGMAIVCPDVRLIPEYERAWSNGRSRILPDCDRSPAPDGVVLPAWFRRERMARLLIPPAASPLHLVLFDIEQHWYDSFQRERRRQRRERSLKTSRAGMFPSVPGWTAPPESDKPDMSQHESLTELDAIQQLVHTTYCRRICDVARSDGSEVEIPARLLLFEGELYAFLTDSYRANVVTHLLDLTVQEAGKADVKQLTPRELKPGDALLFHRGSARDVIRMAADKLLPEGVRDVSSLWRRALVDYARQSGMTRQRIWEDLRDRGCPLQPQTISLWIDNENIIAPQSYERDVRIIADMTADPALTERIDDIVRAIGEVRSAHLRASRQLAEKVIAGAVELLKRSRNDSQLLEVQPDVVVVRVHEIGDDVAMVRSSVVNRLAEAPQWE